MGAFPRKPRVNKTLISLKIIAFLILTGLSALHVLNNRLPLVLGLNFSEYRNITIISTFVAILGPLIVGPLLDVLAAKRPNSYGTYLKILLGVALFLTGILYVCTNVLPVVKRGEPHQPLVSFGCDASGAVIFQQRCSEDNQCHHWKSKVGSINLTRCTYTCQDPTQYENMYTPWLESIPTPSPSTEHSSEFDYEDEAAVPVTESLRSRRNVVPLMEQSSEMGAAEVISSEILSRQKRGYKSAPQKVYVEPPHLCLTAKNDAGESVVKNCHVYTDDTTSILVHTVMKAATNLENDTHSAEWCNYPLDGFQCQIPLQQANYMIQLKNNSDCKPMIECQVIDPYESKGSVLADSECVKIDGDLNATLASYAAVRILADICALACLTLLNTAIVIAVRETSEGRGEVCRQYAWGAVGSVLLFCFLDYFFSADGNDGVKVPVILVAFCFLTATVFLAFLTNDMPLSPPEWWWHTKTGMLVYPMSAIRKYSPEILVLTLVATLFGTFWGSIHSYLYWSYLGVYASYFAGILLTLVLFFNVDKFIEYCGHSNIFIAGFAMYIIRFTALASKDTDWLTNLMEVIEPVVLGIVWITIILYMRHAMPRKFTATGQALAVIAFFVLGKGFGALIGLVHDDKKGIHNEEDLIKFEWLSVAACIIALVYFVIYNLILAPRCAAKPAHLDDLMSGSASQTFANGAGGTSNGSTNAATNGNGAGTGNGNSYSPLRVYHNERGKKGQFRY